MRVFNDYQIQFLRHLAVFKVRYFIVGGHARRALQPSNGRYDLDIWASVADDDKPRLCEAILSWSKLHPMHKVAPFVEPLNLGPNIQITFPECDGVWYTDRDGQMCELSTEDGVDVLTSIDGMDFEACFERAVEYNVEGISVRVMSSANIEQEGH